MRVQGRGSISPLFILLPLLIGCGRENGVVRQEDPVLARREQEMFTAVNHYRDSVGLGIMAWDDRVASIAREHSRDMADGKFSLGHTGATDRTEQVGEIIPWESISENVAYSTERTDIIHFLLDRWLASKGHRTNIEGKYNLTGIGAAESEDGKIYFTQIFVLKQ